jgi:quercetin dioxygenase-like cupin family protein
MSEETAGQFLVTGVDESGHSCASRKERLTLNEVPGLDGLRYSMMYALPILPSLSTGGGRSADNFDLGVKPGAMDWKVLAYEPGTEFSMHHTDTIDFDTVLHGSIDLILDDGEYSMGAGDSVLVTGVDHGWRAGPEGCRISIVSIGVAPPE